LAEAAMAISDIPIFSMLRTRMQWHQERQKVLAENVSNADTPKFQPRDLKPLDFGREPQAGTGGATLKLATTDPSHLAGSAGTSSFATNPNTKYDVRPAGNAVNLEDEMMKVAQNQMDYQAAISLYSRSMGLIRTALSGKT
jgi:flagellar basal-body rod protein FlgB